jgi:RNA polymerase sigma-70 factor, ECF subfamily
MALAPQDDFYMIEEQSVAVRPDPSAWVDEHGDYLFRYAMFRLHDTAAAEDIVQETFLAALQTFQNFAGRGALRTWLVGILKHKITDHFRRLRRETPLSQIEDEQFEHGEFFRKGGQWDGHWKADYAPTEWRATPEELLEQSEFFDVFDECLSPLPARMAAAFTLREVDGLSSEEICEVFSISMNNLWVLLHRARLHLRHCLELNWFKPRAVRQ